MMGVKLNDERERKKKPYSEYKEVVTECKSLYS